MLALLLMAQLQATPVELEIMQNVARARAALRAGHPEAALDILEAVEHVAPESAVVARDLALLRARHGPEAGARHALTRAYALGDRSAEALEARALLEKEADWARRAGSFNGDLLAAHFGDRDAGDHLVAALGEVTPRAAMAALVLAGTAERRGDRVLARNLAGLAQELGTGLDDAEVTRVATSMLQRARAVPMPAWTLGVATSVAYAANPLFGTDAAGRRSGFRGALRAEAGVSALVGPVRLEAAFRFDQHLYLTERDTLSGLDTTGFFAAIGASMPLSNEPNAARVALRVKAFDVFGDAMARHFVTAVEGGPALILPIRWDLEFELGIYGTHYDFVDFSPPDAALDPQNRDRTGQRAVGTLRYRHSWFLLDINAAFVRDDAKGDVFDARGGLLSARIVADIGGYAEVRAMLSGVARQYGPVGDEAFLGDAARRTEVRAAIGAAAFIPFVDRFGLLVSNVWAYNDARRDHRYSTNVTTLGLEYRR